MNNLNRREFMGSLTAAGAYSAFSDKIVPVLSSSSQALIKPPRLLLGDTIGIIAPGSGPFEPSAIEEAKATMESLGFQVQLGRNIRKKKAYLAGSDKERLADLHEMFSNKNIKAIITIRGGYGSGRLVEKIDYELIRKNPKIFVGYSDITALHLAIHKIAGLVTFHGPVALSTFNDYSTKYFLKVLTSPEPVGVIETPSRSPLQKTSGIFSIVTGTAGGALIGGNLTMVTATLGTPFEIDTKGKILFLEEVSEEPYDLDRMLTQLRLAGKLEQAAGIILDKCAKCGPQAYKPAFENTLSVEEVCFDRLHDLPCPVIFGLSIGHVADKPTLPLGVRATVCSERNQIQLEEGAVV